MKKWLAVFLAVSIAAGSLAGCNRNQEDSESSQASSSEPETFTYHNGTYEVSYAVPAATDGTLDYLTIQIEDDEISVVEYGLQESDAADAASSQEAESSEADAAGTADASAPAAEETQEPEKSPDDYAKEILKAYETAGDVEEMDPVEGAQEHTYRFIRMMRTALEFAEAGDTSPVTLGRYADGSYTYTMEDYNRDGWQEYVSLTVKDGLLVPESVAFNAKSQEDPQKTITEDETLNEGENGPAVYYPAIVESYLENESDPSAITVPTNGDAAVKTFQKLMNALLRGMISGDETEKEVSRLVDGKYTVRFSEADENGWKDYLEVEIKNGNVTILAFDAESSTQEGLLKSEATEVSTRMKEATGITFSDAAQKLSDNWEKADGDVKKVDTVVGATVSSNNFKILLGELLTTAAIEGNSEAPLEVARVEAAAVKSEG